MVRDRQSHFNFFTMQVDYFKSLLTSCEVNNIFEAELKIGLRLDQTNTS